MQRIGKKFLKKLGKVTKLYEIKQISNPKKKIIKFTNFCKYNLLIFEED